MDLHEAEDVVGDDVAQELQDQTVSSGSALDLKKTGRPAHPLWAHFHRGEKRNRYHYHAFCIYCVARYGPEQVNPTRGVSHDMLRHLEKCTNCPRKVLESIKDICGKRDADRIDRYMKRQNENEENTEQHTTMTINTNQTNILSDTLHTTTTIQSNTTDTKDPNHVITRDETHIHTHTNIRSKDHHHQQQQQQQMFQYQSVGENRTTGHKRLKTFDSKEIKSQLLKTFVAGGLPFSCIQNADFLQLTKYLRPEMTSDFFQSLFEEKFFQETTHSFVQNQLDRVKEGMLNSTIKGGLTLSMNSWTTKQKQHLVAFSLLNSNGDASIVAVEEVMEKTTSTKPLEICIEKVLQSLDEQKINVMGIVVDSMLGLIACRRICSRSLSNANLLVIPCFSRILSLLASIVLTHEEFDLTINHMIEIASFFSHPFLLNVLQNQSEDPFAFVPLPNRTNWFSFLECLENLLKYQHVIHAICTSTNSTSSNGQKIPPKLIQLVLNGPITKGRKKTTSSRQQFWKKLEQLYQLLSPIKETYLVVFQTNKQEHEANITAMNGLTLGHIMHQLASMNQQYAAVASTSATSSSTSTADIANLLRKQIDLMWKTYEMPVMVLAYMFNFHLDAHCLNVAHEGIEWEMIGKYFKVYFDRWFANDSYRDQVTISEDKIEEIIHAYKTNQFPFDAQTKADYMDVSSFYSFISESHPEISALCCRLYAIALTSSNVNKFIKGIGYVPSIANTTKTPAMVMSLLQIGFASNPKKNTLSFSTDRLQQQKTTESSSHDTNSLFNKVNSSQDHSLMNFDGMMLDRHHVSEIFWTSEEWQSFRQEWEEFVQQEQVLCQQIGVEQLTTDQNSIINIKMSLEEAFAKDLPSLLPQIHEEITLV